MIAPTFVKVYEDELAGLAKLSPAVAVLLAARLLSRGGWATRRRDVQNLTGLKKTHVNTLLLTLEQRGFLRREFCGASKDPWGRFKLAELATNRGMLLTTGRSKLEPEHATGRGMFTSQDPDPDLIPPSIPVPARARARVRDGGMDVLLILVRELWPNVALKVASKNVARLRELANASDDELGAYLRHSATDETLARATLPLAAACTPDRVEPWFARRARARAAAHKAWDTRRERSELSPAQQAEHAKRALAELRRPKR